MTKRQLIQNASLSGTILRPATLLLFILFLSAFATAFAQNEAKPAASPADPAGAPVTLDSKTIFEIRAASKGVTIEERAQNVSSRIKKLADSRAVDINKLQIVDTASSSDIYSGDTLIIGILDADAKAAGKTRASLAADRMVKIKNSVTAYREKYGLQSALIGIGFSVLTIAIFLFLVRLIRRNFPKARGWMQDKTGSFISTRRWRIAALIDAEQVKNGLGFVLNLLQLALLVTMSFVTLQLVLGFLPWTQNIANSLLGLLVGPLQTLGTALVLQIPNLIFIGVVIVIAYYSLKILKAFFRAIQFRKITFRGFEPSWAMFTYRLVKILVVILAMIVCFPYIPGSNSEAFRAVSIFLGLLVSFGSTSVVANTMGGITLNYLRTFNVGDRVKIGDYTGDIVRSSLQVTHLRTIKNEEIMVPNSMVVTNQIVNYSSYSKDQGLILHTTVTIGYDAPWRQVHALLLAAAEKTEGLINDPKPFILQTSLDDFYASYELNVYTKDPRKMAQIYSDLHENIQDQFNEYGVQIMSPNYMTDRDEKTFVPKDKWYEAPAKKEEDNGKLEIKSEK